MNRILTEKNKESSSNVGDEMEREKRNIFFLLNIFNTKNAQHNLFPFFLFFKYKILRDVREYENEEKQMIDEKNCNIKSTKNKCVSCVRCLLLLLLL